LLFSFRHSTAKTFFLSLLSAIVLLILTSLVLAFTGWDEEGVYNSLIFYFVVALGLSIGIFFSDKRQVATGIALNLFLWLLPFVPLCIVASYYERLRRLDYERYYERYDAMKLQHLFYAEVIGIVLLVVMIGTYVHKAYRRWYASPEG